MKIAINCIFYQPRGGGIAEYIYNLVSNIEKLDKQNEYVLYVLKDMKDFATKNFPSRFKIKTLPYTSSFTDKIRRSLFPQCFWHKEEELEKFDLFHSPFFHSPSFKRTKVVLTVHDMRFFRFPYTYTKLRYVFLKYAVRKSCENADHIIAISHFTKNELMEAYRIPENRITVIHEAINKERFSIDGASSFVLPQDVAYLDKSKYILSVGHLEPWKNYELLIDAFVRLKQNPKMGNLKLLIVGKKGHHYKEIIRKINETSDVVYLDFVSHELLQWLYGHAELFVFPSFYEGFGFPPLEAGCYGVPSAVSHVSSMPEICGDSVFYFDPYDEKEMAAIIQEALIDEMKRNEMKDRMSQRIGEFSWRENAQQTITVYEKIVNMVC